MVVSKYNLGFEAMAILSVLDKTIALISFDKVKASTNLLGIISKRPYQYRLPDLVGRLEFPRV